MAKIEWHQGELFPQVGFIVTNLTSRPKFVVHFYNQSGTAEQWIKEGKYAVHWTLTTLRNKLVKIGCNVVYHARYVTCQLAEVAVPRRLYRTILDRIRRFGTLPPRAATIWRSAGGDNPTKAEGTALSVSPIAGQIVCPSIVNGDLLPIHRRLPAP